MFQNFTRIASADEKARMLITTGGAPWGFMQWGGPTRYHLENFREAGTEAMLDGAAPKDGDPARRTAIDADDGGHRRPSARLRAALPSLAAMTR
jgi:hypothetical protein